MAQIKNPAIWRVLAFSCLACSLCAFGQPQTAPSAQPVQSTAKQTAKPSPAQPVQPATPPAAASLLDHPAQAAKVSLTSGKLTVRADNSSLSDILHQISKASGMKIDGLQAAGNPDQRIFGSYGPGAPREVLSDLLDGCGYNVLMLGETASGAPRELAVTLRTSSSSPGPPPQANNNAANDDDGPQVTQYPPEQQNPNPPPGPPEIRNGARTPQQLLQELQQRMRQQQQEQQQQQQEQQDQEEPPQPDEAPQ